MKIIFAVGLTLIFEIGLALNAYAAGDATKGKPHMQFVLPVMEQTVWETKL